MVRLFPGLIFLTGSLLTTAASSQTNPFIVTSAAGGGAGISAGGLATATGAGLAAQTASAVTSSPWPTTLGGLSIQVQDSGSVTRPAGLLFVSAGQINFQVPVGTALGPATITIVRDTVKVGMMAQVQPVAPGLLAVNSDGVAAATAVALAIPTANQFPVTVFQCGDTAASCKLVPIDPGVDRPVYLSFYGTGFRNRTSLNNVKVTIGTVDVAPTYAGPQGQFDGLDQINVPLVLSLRGAGTVNVTVTVDGVTSNPVKIAVM